MVNSKKLQKNSKVKYLKVQHYITINYYYLTDAILKGGEKRSIGEFRMRMFYLDTFLMKRDAKNKSLNLFTKTQKILIPNYLLLIKNIAIIILLSVPQLPCET